MHAMKFGTPGSVRPGLPLETFCEDPLRLGVNLAKRMTVRETAAFVRAPERKSLSEAAG
jgi:hypothetical protein